MKLALLPEPSLTGPKIIRVGSAVYGVPQGAGVVPVQGGRLVYVLAYARVHAFTEAGEVRIPDDLRPRIASAHFGANRKVER